jgi:hypothetical protein
VCVVVFFIVLEMKVARVLEPPPASQPASQPQQQHRESHHQHSPHQSTVKLLINN